jgi:uncharacterized protein YkwD
VVNPGVSTRLRPGVAAFAIVGLLLLHPVGSAEGGRSQLTSTVLEASTVHSINALRVANDLAPLTVSSALFRSAMLHDVQMLQGGYFSHLGPDGSTFSARVAAFYPVGSHHFYSVGENLLWSLVPLSSDEIVARWMKSPGHRFNMLNPAWRQIAVAALSVDSAPGVYGDAPVTVVTVDFGVRR